MDTHLAGLEQAGPRPEGAGDVRRRQAAGLDVARVPQPALLALLLRRRARAANPATSASSIALSRCARVVAGVVGQPDGCRVGELGDEVLAPDLGRIHLHVARGLLDDALDHVGRLGPPGAAVGVDRRGVGEYRLDLAVDRRRPVLAGQQGRVQDRRHRRSECRQIGAHVGDGVDAQREELALRVQRHLGLGDVVAPVRIGQECLAALGRPLDRPADALGGPDQRASLRGTGRSSTRSRRRRRARSPAPSIPAGRVRKRTSAAARRAGSGWPRRACSSRRAPCRSRWRPAAPSRWGSAGC